MPPKKKPKTDAKKAAASAKPKAKAAPEPKFVHCESTGQKVFIARATLADLKSKSTYTTAKKRLWTLTSSEKRHACYQQAALCICHQEQDLLPSVGKRSWEVSASVQEPNSMVLFRPFKGQMELAVLPHWLEKIPQPPLWAGKRRQDIGSQEYQDNREDNIAILAKREISSLSTVAWELRHQYPVPTLSLKWKSPDHQTFGSRKAAWEHAAILAKREVLLNKHLCGMGAFQKLLQPSKPTVATTLQVGKLRFERDGLWVVGQEVTWQEGRVQELRALAAEPAETPKDRKWSAIALFLFETRDSYRQQQQQQTDQSSMMTYRQAETELRQVWKTTMNEDQKMEWAIKARLLNGEEIEEEQEEANSEVEEETATTKEQNTEETNNDGDQKTTLALPRPWTALTYYVHCKRHAYREDRKMKDGSFTLKDTDTELREIFKTLPNEEQKEWKIQAKEAVLRQGATPTKEQKPSKVQGLENSVGPLEQGSSGEQGANQESKVEQDSMMALAIVHSQIEMQPIKADERPLNCPSSLVDEIEESPCPPAKQPSDDRSETPDMMVEEEEKKEEEMAMMPNEEEIQQELTNTPPHAISTTTTTTNEETIREEATAHPVVNSSTPEPEVKREAKILHRTVSSTPEPEVPSSLPQEDSLPPQVDVSTAKEPVPETTESAQACGLIKKPRRKQPRKKDLTSYNKNQRWCLDPNQISLCHDAIMDHFDKVMLTVKSRDLLRELEDGFDLCRQRGRGRFDMELPSFDTEIFSFLTDLEQAPWMPIVKTILGDDAVLIHKGSFMSLPGAEAQDYHQDGVHLTTQTQRPCHAINVFVPLVDLATRNGPTEFCLGSHILGHEDYDRDFVETPKVQAGIPIIFDYRLGHRGMGNSSQACRPIVYCTYARAAGGKEFQDSVNFSRKRYHKLGELVERPLSRAERSKKRKREIQAREEVEFKKALELSQKEETSVPSEPSAEVQEDKISANKAGRDDKADAGTEPTPPEPVKEAGMEHVSDNNNNNNNKIAPAINVADGPVHPPLPCGQNTAELHEAAIAMALSDSLGSNS